MRVVQPNLEEFVRQFKWSLNSRQIVQDLSQVAQRIARFAKLAVRTVTHRVLRIARPLGGQTVAAAHSLKAHDPVLIPHAWGKIADGVRHRKP